MARTTPLRRRLLGALRVSPHRYDILRAGGMAVTLAVLFAVPSSGLARLDLLGGRHRLLFEPTSARNAFAGVVVAIGAFYVATFLVNLVGGRLFCGWGCPIGQLSRFGEALEVPQRRGRSRARTRLAALGFSAALAVSVLTWWVDPRSLATAGPGASAAAGAAAIALTLVCYAHGRWWRWRFCMTTCPIGLYYSFVSPAHWFGVHFRNEAETCIDCDACDNVCPVELAPRDLFAPTGERPGISIAEAPGRNHCLECGDCVRACEWIIARSGEEPVPLLLGFFSGPQSSGPIHRTTKTTVSEADRPRPAAASESS